MTGCGIRKALWVVVLGLILPGAASSAETGWPLAQEIRDEVDKAARETLASTGVPSVSIAVVKEGQLAYAAAYGAARLEPRLPAGPEMRYSIGSISKQFTAAAILMLAEEHKLSLDDPVARFLPDLTRSGEVRIRQLLSHTSGYQDYWPQDYVPPFMRHDITAAAILDRWAKRPLDFEPATQYQYSNTGYVIAGLVVERASGMPLLQFLRARVFDPLGMTSIVNVDQDRLGQNDPIGYVRYGLGPPRAAPKEGKGWLFAAGELAMTAQDLAKWNISVMGRSLMSPASYAQMGTTVVLKNGVGASYGLGVSVALESGHRVLAHDGEVSGFCSTNMIFPDDRAAVTVLANQDASPAPAAIAKRIVARLFEERDAAAASEARARRILEGLQHGQLDRSLFTDNANSYFSGQAVQDFAASLGPLGAPTELKQKRQRVRGGMTFRLFEVKFADRTVEIWERDLPDGKIEQFQVMAQE